MKGHWLCSLIASIWKLTIHWSKRCPPGPQGKLCKRSIKGTCVFSFTAVISVGLQALQSWIFYKSYLSKNSMHKSCTRWESPPPRNSLTNGERDHLFFISFTLFYFLTTLSVCNPLQSDFCPHSLAETPIFSYVNIVTTLSRFYWILIDFPLICGIWNYWSPSWPQIYFLLDSSPFFQHFK